MGNDDQVHYDDVQVEKVTIDNELTDGPQVLWMDENGSLHGTEHMARYAACDRVDCSEDGCDNTARKNWTACKDCRHKNRLEKYNDLEEKPYPLDTDDNRPMAFKYGGPSDFFHSLDGFLDWCLDREVHPEDTFLVHTEPGSRPRADIDRLFETHLPEGWSTDELDEEIHEAVEHLDEVLEKHAPYGFVPADLAVEIPEGLVKEYEQRMEETERESV